VYVVVFPKVLALPMYWPCGPMNVVVCAVANPTEAATIAAARIILVIVLALPDRRSYGTTKKRQKIFGLYAPDSILE
jgi:hypothetical protein